MRKQVMTRAWEIAKEGVKRFGGKVKEFFRQALIMAWEEVKGGNKMVELKGSEKQIKWAEDIRKTLLNVINSLKTFQEKAGDKIPEEERELENQEIERLRIIAEDTERAAVLISLYSGLKKNDWIISILLDVCNGYFSIYDAKEGWTTIKAPALKRLVDYAIRKKYVVYGETY